MASRYMELVREGYDRFKETGDPLELDEATPDFAWDMSKFSGWPEQAVYEGVEGSRAFLADWTAPWEDWQLELEELHDGGDRIVAILRQHARSKLTGMPLDMRFAQLWTFRDGRRARMEMYSDVDQALRDVGLDPGTTG
jgi:ketosteroid isomerase-like protein